nr:unnamed protein product [Spirometra erinaceieuropaei]
MGVDKKFNDEALEAHNALRNLHGCSPLTYDAELAKQAQSYAEQLARMNRLVHSNSTDRGENLATASGMPTANLSAADASLMWYKEILEYDFRGQDQIACGHFSQLVWKDTKVAGFGVAKTANGQSVYVVGQYKPPGNFMGQWASQVPRPLNGKVVVPTAEALMCLPHEEVQKPAPKPVVQPPKPQAKPPVTTAASTVGTSETEEPNLKSAIVAAHNEFRRARGLQPLRVNSELENLAQKWAESLKAGKSHGKCDWTFRGQPVGQNVFKSRHHKKDADSIIKKWAGGEKYYQGASSASTTPKAAKFTQLVWASSSEIGVGAVLAHRPHRSVVVCFYSPAGNIPSGYRFNVDNYLN